MPDRTKPSSPPPQIPYEEPKRKEPMPEEPMPKEGPTHPYPTFAQTPREAYSRSPAPHIEFIRQTNNVPSYYGQDQPAQPVHNDRNPYELPPAQETANERLPPEKLIQFQKSWRRDNNYTGKPYDILVNKTRVFIDLCRRLEIHESQYTSIFPDILEGRASMHYMHNIGPGYNWKQLYERLDTHFNTRVNHS
jgi:hypothetical protein